jgi:hypothetical protein
VAEVKRLPGEQISLGRPNVFEGDVPDKTLDELSQAGVDRRMLANYKGVLTGFAKTDPRLPPVEDLAQDSETENSITLSWKALPGEWKYTLVYLTQAKMRKANTENGIGNHSLFWVPIESDKVSLTNTGDRVQANMKDIPTANWGGTLGVVATGPDGVSTFPHNHIRALVAAAQPTNWGRHVFWTAVLATISGIGYLWYRRRRLDDSMRRNYYTEFIDTTPEELRFDAEK